MPKAQRIPPKQAALRQAGVLNPHPERVRDPQFAASDFFDPHDLVQVKYEMVRRHQRDGETITEAADSFGLSRPAFYKAQAALEKEGLAGLIPKKRGPRGPHKLTEEVMQAISEWLVEDGSLDAEGLATRVKDRFGVTVHPVSIARVLKGRKKKRP